MAISEGYTHLHMIDRAKSWPFGGAFLELIPSSSSTASEHMYNQSEQVKPGSKSTLFVIRRLNQCIEESIVKAIS